MEWQEPITFGIILLAICSFLGYWWCIESRFAKSERRFLQQLRDFQDAEWALQIERNPWLESALIEGQAQNYILVIIDDRVRVVNVLTGEEVRNPGEKVNWKQDGF